MSEMNNQNIIWLANDGEQVFTIHEEKPFEGAIEFVVSDVELWAVWLLQAKVAIEGAQGMGSGKPVFFFFDFPLHYTLCTQEHMQPYFNDAIKFAIPEAHKLLAKLQKRIDS